MNDKIQPLNVVQFARVFRLYREGRMTLDQALMFSGVPAEEFLLLLRRIAIATAEPAGEAGPLPGDVEDQGSLRQESEP